MMASNSKRRRRSVLTGIVVLVVFVASVGVAITANKGIPGLPRTVVRAEFVEVGGLRSGDDVRINDVRVGQVGEITLVDGKPVVELRFDGHRSIYRNATAVTASVGARSALGQKYVAFNPGSPQAGAVDPGEVIPASETTGAQELSDLLAVLDEPTRKALGSTLRETGGGVAGHTQDLRDTLAALPTELPDLATVSRALTTEGGADLVQTLQAVDRFSGRFQGREQQLSNLVRQLDTTLRSVAVDDARPVSDALTKAPDTLTKVRGSLEALRRPLADTEAAAAALRPGAQALGQATPDVRGVLREGIPPLNKVPGVAGQAMPAVDGLTRTFTDARPVAPRIREAVGSAQQPLAVLAPYAPEISLWFTHATDALHQGDAAGHWLRFSPPVGTSTATGIVRGLRDPLTARNPYPAPGEAARDKSTLLGPR